MQGPNDPDRGEPLSSGSLDQIGAMLALSTAVADVTAWLIVDAQARLMDDQLRARANGDEATATAIDARLNWLGERLADVDRLWRLIHPDVPPDDRKRTRY